MISVIVPIYNVEKYLRECVDSLLGQTYTDIEVILVNDCSPDNSIEICREYEKADSRIRFINKEKNEGLGKARESGVKIAKGDWLCYVDSDDWLEKNTFEEIMERIEPDVDIAVFGMNMCYMTEDNTIRQIDTVYPEYRIAKSDEEVADMMVYLDSHRSFPFMCNKLYNMEFIRAQGVEFNTIKSMEDFFYNIEIFEYAKKIVSIDKAYYNYRKTGKETLVTAYNSEFFELSKKRYLAQKNLLEKKGAVKETNEQELYKIYMKHVVSCLIRDAAPNANLSFKARKKNVKMYIVDSVTKEVLDKYKPQGSSFKIITFLLKKKMIVTLSLVGKFAYIFQNDFKNLFRKIVG